MNRKGFTIVELLAALVILAIIMLIAVPSTINVLDRTKKQKYIADAKKMITLAETYIRGNQDIAYPVNKEIIIIKLSNLNDGSFDEDPDGKKYDLDNSFVTITYKQQGSNYSYEYNVQLVGEGNRGVELSNLEKLNGDKKYDYVKKNVENLSVVNTTTCSKISSVVFGNTTGTCKYK